MPPAWPVRYIQFPVGTRGLSRFSDHQKAALLDWIIHVCSHSTFYRSAFERLKMIWNDERNQISVRFDELVNHFNKYKQWKNSAAANAQKEKVLQLAVQRYSQARDLDAMQLAAAHSCLGSMELSGTTLVGHTSLRIDCDSPLNPERIFAEQRSIALHLVNESV